MDKHIKDLERKVRERIAFLQKVSNFFWAVAPKHGRQTKYRQGSSNIHIEFELVDFGGFSFVGSAGHTMFGGNDLKVTMGKGKKVVLDFFHQGTIEEDCKVSVFVNGPWQRKLLTVMKDKARIIRGITLKKKTAKKKLARVSTEKKQRELVLSKASKLGLAQSEERPPF